MKKVLGILLILALMSLLFWVNASDESHRDVSLDTKDGRLYLNVDDHEILLDRDQDLYDYAVEDLADGHLVTGDMKMLGSTGHRFKVYYVNSHGKVWHDNELNRESSYKDGRVNVTIGSDQASYDMKSVIDKLEDEGAFEKVDIINEKGIQLSDISHVKMGHETFVVQYEMKSEELNLIVGYVNVVLDEKIRIKDIYFGEI